MYEWFRIFLLYFLDLVNIKPLVPSERLLSPRVSVRVRSNRKSNSVNVDRRSTTIAYARRSFYRNRSWTQEPKLIRESSSPAPNILPIKLTIKQIERYLKDLHYHDGRGEILIPRP